MIRPPALFLAACLPLLLASGALGCSDRGESSEAQQGEPLPEERVEAIKLQLGQAHRAWSEGQREEAQRLVREAYAAHFEPLEPALRMKDPLGTLALEYAFGRLEETFGQPGNPVVVIEEVRALNKAVAEAVAALSVPPEAGAGGADGVDGAAGD